VNEVTTFRRPPAGTESGNDARGSSDSGGDAGDDNAGHPSYPGASSDRLAEADLERTNALEIYQILDSATETSYDDITRLAAYLCGTSLALISFFDRDRQWVKARYSSGTFSEKPLDLPSHPAFIDTTVAQPDGVVLVPDMTRDQRFAGHPMVGGAMRLRFYAAAALVTPTGDVVGSLCVMDRRTRTLSPEQMTALQTLAHQVVELLEMRRTVIGLSHANARLGKQSLTDALTGVPNRRAYETKILEEHSRSRRTGASLSLLLIDIDMFKQFNDTFGHPAGDSALQSVARVLQSSLRPYDFLARYGGEEFVIVLPATELSNAIIVAERVRGLVMNSEFPHRKFTISIGVARLEAHGDIKTLVQIADNGLHRAKSSGRNKVVVGQLGDGPL
jgi:diguanylate cyclase (GGDEF)-like protein